MLDEKFIDDLFEAARQEPAVRTLDSVEQFVQTAGSGTSASLIVEWLKQHKMNMLITAGSVMIATSVLMFATSEVEESPIVETIESPVEQVEETITETETEQVKQDEEPSQKDQEVTTNEVEETQEQSTNEDEVVEEVAAEVEEDDTSSEFPQATQPAPVPSNPISQATPKAQDPVSESEKSPFKEHLIVLESAKGQASADAFSEYLTNNLSQLNHAFSSRASQQVIRKFTLEMDNRIKASFKMQVSGFEKFELHWEANGEGAVKSVWYRLDGKEQKEMDFSPSSKSSVKVKHTHEEF